MGLLVSHYMDNVPGYSDLVYTLTRDVTWHKPNDILLFVMSYYPEPPVMLHGDSKFWSGLTSIYRCIMT